MSRLVLASTALVALMTSCADAVPAATASLPSASGSSNADGLPGRPLDATAILEAMRDSRRPGGVPDELQTDAIAGELADLIWTVDGEQWSTMSVGGSCGAQMCALEIAGAHPDSQGDDVWAFEIAPDSEGVEVVSTELRSLTPDRVDQLDEMTRSMFPGLESQNLTSARWLPPPDDSQFVLSYRDSSEERSGCGADITVDAVMRTIVSDLALDC